MPTATYSRTADFNFGSGYRYLEFNPTGESAGAVVDNVRFDFLLSHDNGSRTDLGDVDIYLQSPEGKRVNIYNNFDGFGDDTDDHNDSDDANDYDIDFSGSGSKSDVSLFLDGEAVAGNWRLYVQNDTGDTLTLYHFNAYFDFVAPDLTVNDIRVSETPFIGDTVTITADLQNIGNDGIGPFDVEFYVNGSLAGTTTVSFGLFAGQSNEERIFYEVTDAGPMEIEARIVGTSGESSTSNNSRTETFEAVAPDLIVKDIKLTGHAVAGETMGIEAVLKHIGNTDYGGLIGGGFDLEYWVNGTRVGTDAVSFGLTPGQENSESTSFTVATTGEQEVEVRIVGTSGEASTSNNSRTEYAGVDHDGTQKTIANSADAIKLAAFLARAVYGDEQVPDNLDGDPDDNGRDDNYRSYFAASGWTVLGEAALGEDFNDSSLTRFQSGGLFEGRSSLVSVFWEAQALLVEGVMPDGERTLAYVFRGTDGSDLPLAATGQAWTGNGQYDHYSSHRPLVEAAIAYANDAANGIEKFIVAGHSLGGAMVDIFTAVDAQHLKDSIDLTAISLASAGINPNTLLDSPLQKGFLLEYDATVALPFLADQSAPGFYLGLSHSQDSVTFPEDVTNDPLDGLTPNATLLLNDNFDGGLVPIDLPNIGNLDIPSGFGAEHNAGLYWANLSLLAADPLAGAFTNQNVILGRTDYANAPDFGGSAFEVFSDYDGTGVAGNDDDKDAEALIGSGAADYMLGLSGDDVIDGGGGDDLLSGGTGTDLLSGAAGGDRMHGGDGFDTLFGGSGNDFLDGGTNPGDQGDILIGGTGNDVYIVDSGLDLVDEGIVFGGEAGGVDEIISMTDFYWDFYSAAEVLRIGEDAVDPEGDGTTAVGSLFSNFVVGNSDTNVLFGRGGADTYIAGDGVDYMSLSTLGLTDENAYEGVDGANTVIVEERTSGDFSYDIVFEFEPGKDRIDVSDYGLSSGADMLSSAFDDGAGSSYIILGDGLDYLYMVGLEKADLLAGDFLVA